MLRWVFDGASMLLQCNFILKCEFEAEYLQS